MRAFFAIDIPAAYKQSLAAYQQALREQLANHYPAQHFKWVPPEKFHVTLQFLPQVKEEQLVKLLQAVETALTSLTPFYLQFGSVEWFPTHHQPTILSLPIFPQNEVLALATAVASGISAAGFAVEKRAFRGHLTLARIEHLSQLEKNTSPMLALTSLPPVFIEEITLFRSDLGARGALYTPLSALRLKHQHTV